ncbi:MAG: HAD family phosphatase [Ruminococcaceae bacterium]|nr:HAD family phosphatase [Oscillospiraceae bacterium]
MIRNIIFDFGNVLARFEPREMAAMFVSDPQDIELLTETVFDRLYWNEADAGTITDEETKTAFCARLPERLHDVACDIYDAWPTLLPPVEGMTALVQELKAQGYPLYLLSNISNKFADEYRDIPSLAQLFSLFDGLVFSAPIGLVKPHCEIFEHLLTRFSLNAEECVFIDDSQNNIDGCEAVGIHGILFDGDAAALRKTLKERGVL